MPTEYVSLKQNAIQLITDHLGSVVSDGYVRFYEHKTEDEVLASVRELMSELLGDKKAEVELRKYNLIN